MKICMAVVSAALLVATGVPAAGALDDPGSAPTTTVAPATTTPPTTVVDQQPDPDESGPAAPAPADPADPADEGPTAATEGTPVSLRLGARFSPNGDRRSDTLPVKVTVAEPSTITVTAFRGTQTLRVLAQDRVVGAGTTDLTWNGKDTQARRVSDGWVWVRVEATPTAPGDPSSQVAASVIDTRPPSFAWRRITPSTIVGRGTLNMSFTTGREKGLVSVRFEMIALNGARARKPARRIPVGPSTQQWTPRRSRGRPLVNGHYLLAAVVADSVGNARVSPVRTILIHRPVRSIPIHRLAAAGNRVALTFDDCNDTGAWASIVRTMARYGAGATYFCNGTNVARNPGLARQTSGQWTSSIGSHSPYHDRLTRFGSFTVAAQLRQDRTTWWNAARTTPTPYFRPPYGAYNSSTLAGAGAAGYRYTVLWDVDTNDWRRPGSAAITQRVLSQARGGSIVLMHTLPQTAAALPGILAGLRRRGLQPVSMDELVHAAHL